MMNRKNNSVRLLPRGGQDGASEKHGPWARKSLLRRAAAIMLGLTVVLSIGVTPAYAFTVPTYLPAVNYEVGVRSRSITNGDFNNDGRPDLAVANFDSHSVSVLLNSGSGAFLPAQDYAFTGSPSDILSADFNGDGYDDLASVGSGIASILIANSNGTFNPEVKYESGAGPYNVVSGDFNGDSYPDLAVSSVYNNIAVLLNNGDGTFADRDDYPAGGEVSLFMTVGDYDGDGYDDLAVKNYTTFLAEGQYIEQISVLYGIGDGTFEASQTAFNFRSFLDTGSALWQAEITSLVSGDFNNDGKDDIAMTGGGTLELDGRVMILQSTGDGSFAWGIYDVGQSISDFGFCVNDINSDGNLDLVVSTPRTGSVTVMRGGGDCTFTMSGVFYVGIGSMEVTSADFNGDGRPDLAVSGNISPSNASCEVAVLINDNGDHRLFVVSNNASGGSASGTGSFSEGASVQVTATANEGYYFTGWTDAAGNALSADASYSYTMPAVNTAIVATFARAPMFPAVVIVNGHSFSVTVCNTYGALDGSFSTDYGSITGTASGNDTVLTGTLTGVPDTWTEITLNGIKLIIRAAALPDTTVTNPSFY